MHYPSAEEDIAENSHGYVYTKLIALKPIVIRTKLIIWS